MAIGKCEYCTIYRTSNLREDVRKDGGQIRYCKRKDKRKDGDSIGCDQFRLHRYFFCHSNGCWITPEACLNRIFNHYDNCEDCRQGNSEVVPLMRGRRERPQLIRRNHENEGLDSAN